jgi:hypothetical protein
LKTYTKNDLWPLERGSEESETTHDTFIFLIARFASKEFVD